MSVVIRIYFLFNNLKRSLLFSLGLFLFLMKLAVDSLLYLFDFLYGPWALAWKILISLPLVYLVFVFVFKDFNEKFKLQKNISSDKYFSELLVLLYLLLGIIVLIYFLPENIANRGQTTSIISLYIINITACYAIIAGIYIIRFLYKWSLVHRHKKTNKYIKYLKYSIFIVFLFEIPNHFAALNSSIFRDNTGITIVSSIIVIYFLIIMLFMTNRNDWIAVLPTGKKWRLILFSTLLALLSIIVLSSYGSNSSESKTSNALYFLLFADTLFIWPLFLMLPYLLRIILSSIGTLPTSRIVERKTSEVSSLADLNRIVSQSVNFDELIETVTKLALNASGAAGAWTEIYKDETVKIKSIKNVFANHIDLLHENNELKDLFLTINETYLIEVIAEHPEFSKFQWKNIPFAKSAIIVPLFSNKLRMGTLIILHQEEYGFETSDVDVMTAFASNVSIALENARLVKDSIEKERFKRDLMLAREIQQKLLPQKLPAIDNYSLAAFSEPAEEVGGDYYDIVELKNGKTCIIIGDVSGKGISAAFYMAQLKGIVLAAAHEANSSADILIRINRILYKSIEKNMFITLSALMIDDNQGKVKLARAGHMPFLVINQDNSLLITPKGIGAGLVEDSAFQLNIQEIDYNMTPGESIIMFTDGLNELRNKKNEDIGLENLKQINKNSVYNHSANEIIEIIKQNVVSFSEGVSHHDDITAIALVYRPGEINE